MRKTILIVGIAALVFVCGCYNAGQNQTPQQVSIRVSGAWALYPMMVKWAEEYQKIHPNVKIDISAGGAGKGMADALGGLVDLGMVSRNIDPAEIEKGAFPIRVVKDAVVSTFNKKNPAAAEILSKGVTRQKFKDIFVSGNLTTWGEAVGKPEIKTKIIVYTRSDSCGAAETWANYLSAKQEDLKGVGVYGDPGIADAVSNNPSSIGFNNLNFAFDNSTGKPVGNVFLIPIDLNEDGVIDGKESFYSTKGEFLSAIIDGRYPSPPARDLYLVAKRGFSGPAKDFVRWILTDGQKYVADSGYISPQNETLVKQLEELS